MRKDLLFSEHPLDLGVVLPPVELPAHFPNVESPRFLYGDRLQWITNKDKDETDWGIVIGRFYGFAAHRRSWQWCYLIWLDSDSPSSHWTVTDTAWEDDLELKEAEEVV